MVLFLADNLPPSIMYPLSFLKLSKSLTQQNTPKSNFKWKGQKKATSWLLLLLYESLNKEKGTICHWAYGQVWDIVLFMKSLESSQTKQYW